MNSIKVGSRYRVDYVDPVSLKQKTEDVLVYGISRHSTNIKDIGLIILRDDNGQTIDSINMVCIKCMKLSELNNNENMYVDIDLNELEKQSKFNIGDILDITIFGKTTHVSINRISLIQTGMHISPLYHILGFGKYGEFSLNVFESDLLKK